MTAVAAPPGPMTGAPPVDARAPSPGLGWLALAAVLVPLAVSAFVLLVDVGNGFQVIHDNATNTLRTADVGHHAVLLGPYSRDGWSHPGPAMYYLLAVPYHLVGGHAIGLYLGALIVNGVSSGGMALIARRRGGTVLMVLTLLGLAVVVHALGADFVRDPWNPYLPVLPFGLLLFLVWATTCGDAWALPAAAAVGTFCVQTHVGYAPLVLPLLVLGAGWLAVESRRARPTAGSLPIAGARPSTRAVLTASLAAVAVLAVSWFPPVFEEVTHSPGNLTRLVDYFAHPPRSEAHHTLTEGYRIVAAPWSGAPAWIVGATRANPFTAEPRALGSTPLPWLAVPFAAGALLLWRRRVADGWRLAIVVAVAAALGVAAVGRTLGPLYDYRLRWTWICAMTAALVIVWAGWLLVAERLRRAAGTAIALTAVAILAALSGLSTVAAARAGTPQEPDSSRLAALVPQAVKALPPGGGDVIVRAADFLSGFYRQGLVLALEQRHVTARVDGTDAAGVFGSHRVHRNAPVRAVLVVASNHKLDRLLTQPGLRLVAYWSPLPAARRAQLALRLAALDVAHQQGTISAIGYFYEQLALEKPLAAPAVAVLMDRRAGP